MIGELIDVIHRFLHLIADYNYDFSAPDEIGGKAEKKVVLRCQLALNNGSRLICYKSWTEKNGSIKYKYSFQWMSENDSTLFRWDNTPHFPEFDTFPFHRHVGPDEIAEPFQEVNLEDVLFFIAAQLLPTSN